MKPVAAPELSLEFLSEPAFLLRRHGEILSVNVAARQRFGIQGGNILDRVVSAHERFDAYLRNCSGSTSPLVGSATFETKDGPVRFRLHGALVPRGAAGGILVLRCLPGPDQFALLAAKVRDLNAELRRRQSEKAVLEETLQHNQTLVRELQHRVKNNIQLMETLIRMSSRRSRSPEVNGIVEVATLRLQAMAATQDAVYRSTENGTVSARTLLQDLVLSIGQSFGASSSLELELVDVNLRNDLAHPLALITSELSTNAFKYGRESPQDKVRVTFGPVPEGLELIVRDNGPGIDDNADTRSSGLKLVRALCRQIGGSLTISNEGGTKCSVLVSSE